MTNAFLIIITFFKLPTLGLFKGTVETGYNKGLGKLDFVRYNRFSL
jgi:hypothetical protein